MSYFVGNSSGRIARPSYLGKYAYAQAGYMPEMPKKTVGDKLCDAIALKYQYRPAEFKSQAVEFMNSLGINEIYVKDLKLMNFINEGFISYMNKSGKKLPKIDIITDTPFFRQPFDMPMSTGFVNGKRFVYVNPTYYTEPSRQPLGYSIQDINDVLKSSFVDLTQDQKTFLENAIRYPQHATQNEKDITEHIIYRYKMMEKSDAEYYLGLLNNKNTWQTAKKLGFKLLTTKEFAQLNRQQIDEYFDFLEEIGCRARIENKTKFSSLYHELGHIEHRNCAGNDEYERLKYGFNNVNDLNTASQQRAATYFAQSDSDAWMASHISDYAMTCPVEFVAEMYASKLTDNDYCPQMLDMYDRYQGQKMTLRKRIMDSLKK